MTKILLENKNEISPSLNQGKQFEKYQTKIIDSLEESIQEKEGFETLLTQQTDNVINNNNYSSEKETINNLRKEQAILLKEYETLEKQISDELNGYIERIDTSNPYLNKVISFTTGEHAYVTDQGVVKLINTPDIWKTLNISQQVQIKLNIPWNNNYNTPGTQIPTNPSLVSGTPVSEGQSLGNEGSNVFVNQLLPEVTPKYMDCYSNNSNILFIGGNPTPNTNGNYTYDLCKQEAINNNYRYFGLQNVNSFTGKGYCAVSNSEDTIKKNDVSMVPSKMIELWSSKTGGQIGNSAVLSSTGSLQVINSKGEAVYSSPANAEGNYFLILQNDGNMCVYRGTNPNNNKGGIWCTMTNGKKQTANPNMIAKKGKYGRSWIENGSTLSAGDFIGSDDGKLALVMQSDGNLVLYAYDELEINCKKMQDGNMGGGIGANAFYDIGMTAVKQNMGKLGYIDADSNLYTYPDSNQKYTNRYTIFKNVNTKGNDILNASFGNTTEQKCQTSCDDNLQCAGFVFDSNSSSCFPKNSGMYPYGGQSEIANGFNIYTKAKEPSNPPFGVSQNVKNTNSIMYEKYINKGKIATEYRFPNPTIAQKKQLEQLQTRLDLISKQITQLTDKFQNGTTKVEDQSKKNIDGISKYLTDLTNINKKSTSVSGENNSNIQNILNDSDIEVLRKNYDYLFWSILAAGTVLVSMNIA